MHLLNEMHYVINMLYASQIDSALFMYTTCVISNFECGIPAMAGYCFFVALFFASNTITCYTNASNGSIDMDSHHVWKTRK